MAVAEIETLCPLLRQLVPEGLTVPSPEGFTEVVKLYCVAKLAVYVAEEDGTVIEWDCAPLSLHEA